MISQLNARIAGNAAAAEHGKEPSRDSDAGGGREGFSFEPLREIINRERFTGREIAAFTKIRAGGKTRGSRVENLIRRIQNNRVHPVKP